jgi:hypothetical protein
MGTMGGVRASTWAGRRVLLSGTRRFSLPRNISDELPPTALALIAMGRPTAYWAE